MNEINQKIAKKESELNNGGLSQKKAKKINGDISKLHSSYESLEQVKTEISILENSSQTYNIVRDNSLNVTGDIYGNGAETRSGACYNVKTDMFDILLGDDSLGLLAHELKHAYQFETGDFSSSPYKNGTPFYDQTDEREAYDRGAMFGQPQVTVLPNLYNLLQEQTSGIQFLPEIIQNNPSVLQSIANRYKAIFRWRGVTYKRY